MLTPLLEYVEKSSPLNVAEFSLEDVALCCAVLESLADSLEAESYAAREEAVARLRAQWLERAAGEDAPVLGRRQQPLLRAVLHDLTAGRFDELTPDDLCFLLHVHKLLDALPQSSSPRRPAALLAPLIAQIEERQSRLAPVEQGLPGIARRVRFVTPRDLSAAGRSAIEQLGDVPYEFRGAVFEHTGVLKVVGNIPEQCAVLVRGGGCYVTGYVLGCLAAGQDCEITENISGAVVSIEGNIRARKLIDRALVVAQRGKVVCRQANIPRLVFAGERIDVLGGSVMGSFVSRAVHVHGNAVGGEFHVCGALEAHEFRHSDARPLRIVLRREVSGKDYGRKMPAEIVRMLSQYRYLTHRRRMLAEYIATTQEEVERHAKAGLLYLMGGSRILDQLEALNKAGQRLATLNRIITGLYEISTGAEEQLRDSAPGRQGQRQSSFSLLANVTNDLAQMDTEYKLDQDLASERERLIEFDRQLSGQQIDKAYVASTLKRVRITLEGWLRERQELIAALKAGEARLNANLEKAEALKRVLAQESKVQLFEQMMAAAGARPPSDPLARRAGDTFVRVLARILQQRQRQHRHLTAQAQEVERETHGVYHQLIEDVNAKAILELEAAELEARATGRFEPGIFICTDPMYLEDSAPDTEACILTSSSDQLRTFRRVHNRIVEESAG